MFVPVKEPKTTLSLIQSTTRKQTNQNVEIFAKRLFSNTKADAHKLSSQSITFHFCIFSCLLNKFTLLD